MSGTPGYQMKIKDSHWMEFKVFQKLLSENIYSRALWASYSTWTGSPTSFTPDIENRLLDLELIQIVSNITSKCGVDQISCFQYQTSRPPRTASSHRESCPERRLFTICPNC